MKVKELIERLSKYDPSDLVVFETDVNYQTYGTVESMQSVYYADTDKGGTISYSDQKTEEGWQKAILLSEIK